MNQEYKVNLSQGQKAKLAKAIKDGSALKLRLSKNALSGPDELLLSPRQIAKLQKAKKNNTGVEISFSKSAIRKSIKQGGSLWTSLLKLTPFLTKGVSKVAPHLATGALSALGSLGIGKSDQYERNAYKRTKNFGWKRPSKWAGNCVKTYKKANSWRLVGNACCYWNSHGN